MKKPNKHTRELRERELAECATPKDEVQRIAQIILSVIQHQDGTETIDWQIARAIVADREKQEEEDAEARDLIRRGCNRLMRGERKP